MLRSTLLIQQRRRLLDRSRGSVSSAPVAAAEDDDLYSANHHHLEGQVYQQKRDRFSALPLTLSHQNVHHTSHRFYSYLSKNNTSNAIRNAATIPTFNSPSPLIRTCQPQHQCHHHRQQQQRRHKSIFVSKHNQSLNITPDVIVDHCRKVGIVRSEKDYRLSAKHVILRECPFCHPHNDKPDNLFKIYICSTTGAYMCHRCAAKGSWFDLKLRLSPGNELGKTVDSLSGGSFFGGGGGAAHAGGGGGGGDQYAAGAHTRSSSVYPESTPYNNDKRKPLPMPNLDMLRLYPAKLEEDNWTNQVAKYLTEERSLSRKVLIKYGVGRGSYKFPDKDGSWKAAECVTFPWILSVANIEEQEELRGAKFDWKVPQADLKEDEEEDGEDETTTDKEDSADSEHAPKKSAKSISAGEMRERIKEIKDSKFLLRRIKARAIEEKSWQRLDPVGGGWGLFGYHTIPEGATEVVMTEGEYDAMAVSQATGRPAISLPNGCRSLPVEVLPLLEHFEKIYLWMDNDVGGHEGAEKFAKKLGLKRTYIVRPTAQNCKTMGTGIQDGENADSSEGQELLRQCDAELAQSKGKDQERLPKDANDALRDGYDLEAIIADAKLTPHERIATFAELRDDVLHEIMHPDQYVGAPLPSWPELTNIIKGVRRGELTVLTGPTGSGKTTYLGQMSLDLVEQDVNVLWGSFEIKNTRLVHKLMQQFGRKPLPAGQPEMRQELEALADRFEQLPFHFMKFHGGSDVDAVIDAMDYAVYVNDTQHIILDNMQFMVSLKGLGTRSTFDKFDVQDVAIEKFRKFATEKNVHVTLVVHPRKEQENSNLSISSIYGSAKATQEADTVLILQNNGQKKFIEVKKNRFNGALGTSPLFFDRQSCRYSETPILDPRGGAGGGKGSKTLNQSSAAPKKALENHWDNILND